MLGDVESARVDPHLCDERSVLFTHLVVQIFPPVVGVAYKDLGVQHGGVAELGAVPAAQQTPSQLALVHHGGHHEAGLLQGLPPELEALELGHHWRSTSPDREVEENKRLCKAVNVMDRLRRGTNMILDFVVAHSCSTKFHPGLL